MNIKNIIKEEVQNFMNEGSREHLLDYFINMWSVSQNVKNIINNSNYLTQKYKKFLNYSEEDWNSLSDEELTKLWNNWDVDENLLNRK